MTDASCSVVPSPTHRFPLKLREFSTGVGVSYLDTPMDATSIEIEGSISMEVAGYRNAVQCAALQGGGEAPRREARQGLSGPFSTGRCCCSMYCLSELMSGAPRIDPAKYEPGQRRFGLPVVPLRFGELPCA
ncbi:hypothetical protein [Saccharopolyspora sp. ASAGF58]|uniref:hypothetical protein n=1 Tax=Saccharopolyspora sp. ASAGF58 TaxID=2719023 RepID=UPI001FF08145|nr:hypothetical protein [Saccharopolyspora sp. ASAGF58]